MEENNNNYSYWKDLLKEKDCTKCHQQIIFPEKEFKEDLEYHPNVYVLKEGIVHNDCVNWLEDSVQGKAIYDTETKEFKNWETILKKYPCFSCDYNFTDQDLKDKNWQIAYARVYEKKEVYKIGHLDCLGCCWCQLCQEAHKEIKEKGISNTCFAKNCKNQLGNLVIYDSSDTPKHPECTKEDFWEFHNHQKILGIKVDEKRITAIFENDRQISIAISWLIEKWFWPKDIKSEQLKNFRIDPTGFRVDFEIDDDTDEDITVFMFTEGTYLSKCGCCS